MSIETNHPQAMFGYLAAQGPIVRCPVCGFDCVHPVGVVVNPAGAMAARVEINSGGIHVDKTTGPEGRGVSIDLRFICEQSHAFSLRLHFHKGTTAAAVHPEDDAPDAGWNTIWRD